MSSVINLADPELELIDPTPNIHLLFINFDKMFFTTKLASRAVVRWSKRMYSCAGICSYEGRGGLCDIALSEPLLKLRPRKDLVETLLHEMIHAFLFVTGNDRDRDGHGPNFQAHMHRINKAAGVKITIYHSFHDEVRVYQTHWWRCDGPCQKSKPYFGIVRRTCNRKPGPTDFWWEDHIRKCGGNFIKIKEPENRKNSKKTTVQKPMGDITKFINNNDCPKNNNTLLTNGFTKTNVGNTTVVSQKGSMDSPVKPLVQVFAGKGYVVNGSKINKSQSSDNIADTVRDVWLKKHSVIANAATTNTKTLEDVTRKVKEVWANKTYGSVDGGNKTNASKNKKRNSINTDVLSTPPIKVMKIDDYFIKNNAILKDIYGDDLKSMKGETSKNTTAESNNLPKAPVERQTVIDPKDFVDCPICKLRVRSEDINRHIDECLNKEEIDKLAKNGEIKVEPSTSKTIDSQSIVDLSHPATPTLKDIIDSKGQLIAKPPQFIDSTISVADLTAFISKINNTDPVIEINTQVCPCCELIIHKSMDEHLEECLAFFNNNTTIPEEGPSTSYSDTSTIVIEDDDEDDIFDESLTLNATGTKSPCPVCLTMIEQDDMNNHLDQCLS